MGQFDFENAVFQSTLPCGERPKYTWQGFEIETISIHAPLRGATANMHKYIIAIILLYAKTL